MMLSKTCLLAALAASTVSAVPILDKRQFAYGSTPVRGANIGGWLVLEPFITPSLFDPLNGAAVDEWTFCQNNPNAESQLQSHWSSWVSAGDFSTLAGAGFNLVRIPIGYWAFQKADGDPYIQGAEDYLDQAIGWARASGLKVWIDLHGAPGSQNGYDNSGHRGALLWTTGDTVSVTESVIGQISSKYGSGSYNDVVVGIEMVNEPLMSNLPGGQGATQSYYQAAFNEIRSAGSVPAIMHDGFINPSAWNGFLTGQGVDGAIVDHHEYQVFTDELLSLSYSGHVSEVWSHIQQWGTGQDKYLITGEWTAAMTDCATYLNGYGIGSRYDGSYAGSSAIGSCAGINDISSWDQDLRTATTNFIQAQIQAYEQYTQGWIFWNFKTESAPEWSLFTLMDNGLWPGV